MGPLFFRTQSDPTAWPTMRKSNLIQIYSNPKNLTQKLKEWRKNRTQTISMILPPTKICSPSRNETETHPLQKLRTSCLVESQQTTRDKEAEKRPRQLEQGLIIAHLRPLLNRGAVRLSQKVGNDRHHSLLPQNEGNLEDAHLRPHPLHQARRIQNTTRITTAGFSNRKWN